MSNTDSSMTELLKYAYLSMSGYLNKDIIVSYGIDKQLSSDEVKELIKKYPVSFGEFCKEIGLASNELQVKLYDYMSYYTIKDVICKYSEIVLEQNREQYNHILQKVKKHNLDEIIPELENLAKFEDISGEGNLNQPEENIIISSETPVTEGKEVTAKSIVIKKMTVESSKVKLNSNNGNITISNYNSTGDLPKSTSNAQVLINDMTSDEEITSEGIIKINSSNFNMTGYNCIEIGLNTNDNVLPKEIYIDDIDFSAKLSNNAILIFGTRDNAYVRIKNCHFKEVSNCIRISNKMNARGVIFDFIDCTCDKWESTDAYSGFLLLEDYTSGTKEKEEENNLFAPDKITINFINCYGPNGKIMASSPSEVCGTKDVKTQVVYVYNDAGGSVAYEDGSRYPTITFK